MPTAVDRTNKETLTTLERWIELSIVASMLLLLGFLAYHQFAHTGFFTDQFGSWEMLCLYGPILVSLTAPIARAVSGRRNPARPFDAATNLTLALGSLWLLVVFPFDFSHLADPLPGAVRFVLSWVTNDLGKVPLILQVITGPISALITAGKYLSLRHREPANPSELLTS